MEFFPPTTANVKSASSQEIKRCTNFIHNFSVTDVGEVVTRDAWNIWGMYLAAVLLLGFCCHARLYVLIAIEQMLPENKNNPRPAAALLLFSLPGGPVAKEFLYLYYMTQIVIDKKKYVIVPEKDYQALQRKAALKTKPEKLLSIEEARSRSKKLIRKWASAK